MNFCKFKTINAILFTEILKGLVIFMAVDFNIVGKRIRDARKAKEKMSVSIAYLSKIETGKLHINIERLSEICQLLNVTEGQILNGVSNNSSKYLINEFSELLRKCSPYQQKLIYNLAKTVYESGRF